MGQEITGPADTHRYEQVIIQPVHFCAFKFLSIVVAVFHPVHYHGITLGETIFHIFNLKGFNSVKYTVRNEEQELMLCIIQLNLKFIIPTHTPGPSCSKLTTSLVNNLLKFQSNMNIANERGSGKRCLRAFKYIFSSTARSA